MLSRPLAAFDIETMPDPEFGRREMALEGDDAEVIHQMAEERLKETDGATPYPLPPLHRVTCIAVAWLDPESDRFKLGVLGGETMDERSHLEGFARLFRRQPRSPRLVSWNGNGFDLPVIRYRSMLHGVAMPGLYRTEGDWKWDNYQNRFHTMHLDLMDVLTGYGASRWVGLDMVSRVLGLPGKQFLEGEPYEHVLRGEVERVEEYCKLDVVITLLTFLAWLVHRGDLERGKCAFFVERVRRALAELPFEGWREIEAGLAGWPPFAG